MVLLVNFLPLCLFSLLLVSFFWAATLFYFQALYIRLLLLFLFALGEAKSARAALRRCTFGEIWAY